MICPFVFYERANVPSIEGVIGALARRGRLRPVLVRAFDYKELAGHIGPMVPPPGVEVIEVPDAEHAALAVPGALSDPEVDALYQDMPAREIMPGLLRRVAALEAGLRRIVSERGLTFAVLPEDTDYARGRIAARTLRAMNVPTVVVSPTYYDTIVAYPMFGPRLADDYVVMNEAAKARLVRHDASPERVHVLGSAFLETVPAAVKPRDPLFVLALQGKDWEAEMLADLRVILRAHPTWRLKVKLHPDVPASIAPEGNVDVVATGTMRALLRECTAVIGQSSIALYEAVAAGVPAIFVDYGAFPHEMRPLGRHLAFDPRGLHECMSACVSSGDVDRGELGPSLGAADRIADFLERFAEESARVPTR